MSFHDLPFGVSEILGGLRRWVECESPSWDGAAVSRMVALAANDLRLRGAAIRIIPGERGYGDCALADFTPHRPEPGILVLCHLDTVHPTGTLATSLPWREQDGRCYGPGVFDMKSGTYLAATAIATLSRHAITPNLPVRMLLTSDEESGTPSARALIESIARDQKYVLVPEGAQPNGNLVSGRYPTMRLQLWTRGVPSHALLERTAGRSALLAMTRMVQRIEAMNGDDVSFTTTLLEAGRPVASVPLDAYAEIVCTAQADAPLDAVIPRLRAIADEERVDLSVQVKTRRPLWTPRGDDLMLQAIARDLMRAIGIEAGCDMLFGGSDGNFTGAIGIPTLDALGAVGADAHQLTENIEIASLVPRARLIAGLIATLS